MSWWPRTAAEAVRANRRKRDRGCRGGSCGLLPAETVRGAMASEGIKFRKCLFTPVVTLWVFLARVLSPVGSCREAVAKLLAFRCRWHVELDIRAIKQTMNIGVPRCKMPTMARKEIWMHLLAYNRIRALMAEAAEKAGIEPPEVSFAGALQTVNAFAPMMELADEADRRRLMEILPRTIARHRVGDRPDRYEPRAVKRQAKPIALLKTPRAQAKKRLAKQGAKKS